MKTLALTLTHLRGFMRDWKSVLVLIGLPLVIVGMIFASFGYDSINIPVGTVDKTQDFNYGEFKNETEDFAEIKTYSSTPRCLEDLMEYEVHGCIEIEPREGDERYQVSIYHDNTKNRIGTRVRSEIERISASFNLDYSEDLANETLKNVSEQREKFQDVQSNFTEFDNTLEEKIEFLSEKESELEESRDELKRDSRELEESREDTARVLEDIRDDTASFSLKIGEDLGGAYIGLSRMQNLNQDNRKLAVSAQESIKSANQSLKNYNNDMRSNFQGLESSNSSSLDEREQEYLSRLNETIEELKESRFDLVESRNDLTDINNTLENTLEFYSELDDFNASRVATSVSVEQRGVYRLDTDSLLDIDIGEPDNLNLLRLQTIYSTILVFISLFVSILVSQFITVKNINSKTSKRLEMISDISVQEYLSIFLSSLIIITIPISSVLVFGQYLFQLPLFENIFRVSLIVGLLCAAIVNFGMGIAYLVKEKSITLLVGNLLLVFLSFFSGFILPIQMMSPILRAFGSIQPASVAQRLFDLVILYEQPLSDLQMELALMIIWIITLGVISYKIKESDRI